jgi:hypothetical protein
MTAYYRLTDERVLVLDPDFVAQLAPSKRDTLRLYSVDPKPTPSATQYVMPGPVVVDATTATKTWLLLDKSAEQIAAEAFQALQAAQLELARQVYSALKNGTGTAGERLVRVERVCAYYLRQQFGKEPT